MEQMKLVFSIQVMNEEEAREIVENAKRDLPSGTEVTLIRIGDRSGKNLLLPRLEGRMGKHLQDRKARLDEI